MSSLPVYFLSFFKAPTNSIVDRWRWVHDPITGYSVRGTYQYLTRSVTHVEYALSEAVWLKQAPLKVSVFVWRLLRNRLPTKDNLVRRRVLHHDDTACVGGCGIQETTAFSDVTSLVDCGSSFISGQLFLLFLQSRCWIIFINSVS